MEGVLLLRLRLVLPGQPALQEITDGLEGRQQFMVNMFP